MIILPIQKSEDEDDTPQEWSLLDLNGELLPSEKETEGDDMELGSIHFESEANATMIIASHKLQGKVETLKQPFVVMRPCKRFSSDVIDTSTERDSSSFSSQSAKRMKINNDGKSNGHAVGQNASNAYEVAGVIHSKILFDKYPKSIMR